MEDMLKRMRGFYRLPGCLCLCGLVFTALASTTHKGNAKFLMEQWDDKLQRYNRVYVDPKKVRKENKYNKDRISKPKKAECQQTTNNNEQQTKSNSISSWWSPNSNYTSSFKEFINKPFDYMQIKGGGYFSHSVRNNSQLSTDPQSYTLGAVLGKQFTKMFAVDLEYNYRHPIKLKMYNTNSQTTTFQEWSVSGHTLTVNGRFSVPFDYWFPYVKGGVGVSMNRSGDYVLSSYNKSSVTTFPGKASFGLAWQVGAGICIFHNQRFSSVLEYTYLDRGKFSTKGFEVIRVRNHSRVKNASPKTGTLKDHLIMYGLMFDF